MLIDYKEIKEHVGHEVTLMETKDGDIRLQCDDCKEMLEEWPKHIEPTWHGEQWANYTGGEVDIHD